jgi:hypothetical protein
MSRVVHVKGTTAGESFVYKKWLREGKISSYKEFGEYPKKV